MIVESDKASHGSCSWFDIQKYIKQLADNCQWIILFVTMVGSLYKYYVQHCPLSEVYLIYMMFQELAVLPSPADLLSLYWEFSVTFYITGYAWGWTQDLLNTRLVY
jgi:hypothetical protein